MKKTIILAAMLPFVLASCISFEGKDVKELQEQVAQLQKEVEELQKVKGIGATSIDTVAEMEQNADVHTKSDVSVSKEQMAVKAIKYCLGKYKSELKYNKITSLPKSDGTVDVIIDYKDCGEIMHTYYNVTVYGNGECCVEDISGWVAGHFPHGDKFYIE